MAGSENKEALRRMFAAVFESDELDEAAIAAHFAPEYRQHVNGHSFDYEGFVDHVRAQKARVSDTRISIDRLIGEDDSVVSLHRVAAAKRDGGAVAGKVIAAWRFRDGKIVECDELTRMTAGEAEDSDLGHAG